MEYVEYVYYAEYVDYAEYVEYAEYAEYVEYAEYYLTVPDITWVTNATLDCTEWLCNIMRVLSFIFHCCGLKW